LKTATFVLLESTVTRDGCNLEDVNKTVLSVSIIM